MIRPPRHRLVPARRGLLSIGLVAFATTALVLSAWGCDPTPPPGKTTGARPPATAEADRRRAAPEATPPIPDRRPAEPPAVSADDATPDERSTSRLREVVSSDALRIVREATAGQAASVRIIGAKTAAEQALTTENTLAGYPVRGETLTLDAQSLRALSDTLLDDAAYVWDGRRGRCANRTAKGFRFTRGDERVELWLGIECRQLLWAWRQGGEVVRPLVYVTPDTTSRLVRSASDH